MHFRNQTNNLESMYIHVWTIQFFQHLKSEIHGKTVQQNPQGKNSGKETQYGIKNAGFYNGIITTS